MAEISRISATHFLLLCFFLCSAAAKEEHPFARTVESLKTEKLSHFRFYWHDVLSGKNPSSVTIIKPVSNTSKTGFGMVQMMDNPLTETPDPRSKVWGRAEGLYASASEEKLGLLMAMNFAFESGKYNGSSLSIFGRNTPMAKVREMPVIGGSGLFRFARGYALATTNKFDPSTGDAVVEYNVYVLHY